LDYVLADRWLIPEPEQGWYAERVVYVPHSYQANDPHRRISDVLPNRVENALPPTGFVFCCFNSLYKITLPVFDVWMHLLAVIPDSVLWLIAENPAALTNLRREAQKRGIAGERLIFAPRMGVAEHLARHRLADLFLDTLPYCAHTTASDALWAGLPVLTCLGSTFAGRVAASLLNAVGLPELVTSSFAEYQALALKLVRDQNFLLTLRARLAGNRDTCTLFDAARFARHVEAAYARMLDRHCRGEPPAAFSVEPMV
jgi:predicted O-linked N-acetylglucosamine transferase (SPINDLY family)